MIGASPVLVRFCKGISVNFQPRAKPFFLILWTDKSEFIFFSSDNRAIIATFLFFSSLFFSLQNFLLCNCIWKNLFSLLQGKKFTTSKQLVWKGMKNLKMKQYNFTFYPVYTLNFCFLCKDISTSFIYKY